MGTSLKRIFKSGFVNFWRNGYISLSSMIVMTITLMAIASVVFTGVLLDHTLTELENKVDINVYFVPGVDEEDVLALKDSVEKLPETSSVEYQSEGQVLENFKKRHEDNQITIAALEELDENPLGSQLNISAKSPSQYANIANFLDSQNLSRDGQELIEKINYHDNKDAIDKLSNIIETSDRLGFIIAIVVISIAVLITFNTIRLAIFISRDEIGVMRLVGASTSYIRGPFVVTGIMYGIVSGIVALMLLYPITFWFGASTESFFVGLNLFEYYLTNFFKVAGILIGSGILVGAVSSYLAVRKYIKF